MPTYAKISAGPSAAPSNNCAPSDRRGYHVLATQKPAPPAPAKSAKSGSSKPGGRAKAGGLSAAGSNEGTLPPKKNASPATTGPPRKNTQNHTRNRCCSCGVSGISSGSGSAGSSCESKALHNLPQPGHQLGSGA